MIRRSLRRVWALAIACLIYPAAALGVDVYVAAPAGVILHEKPDRRSGKVAAVPFRGKVGVLSAKGPVEEIEGLPSAWFRVEYQNHSGWVFAGFLSAERPGSPDRGLGGHRNASLRRKTLEVLKGIGEPLVGFDEMKDRWWPDGEPGPDKFRAEYLAECLTERRYKAFHAFRRSARDRTDEERIHQVFDLGGFDFGILPCDLDRDGTTDVVVQLKAGKLLFISLAKKEPLPFGHGGKPFHCGPVLVDWEWGVPRMLFGTFEPDSGNACHIGLRDGKFENTCDKTCGCMEE